MTFDLHYSNEHKAEAYKLWVKRIYAVASTLNLSYAELWDLPEQEFLVLEEIAAEQREAEIEKRKKLQEGMNNG